MNSILRHPLTRNLAMALLAIAAALSVGKGFLNAMQPHRGEDLQWGPPRALIAGTNPYTEYLANPTVEPHATATHNVRIPNYPVSGYFFLIPVALFDWPTAKTLWAISNILCALFIVYAIDVLIGDRPHRLRSGLTMACLFLIASPLRDHNTIGQHTLFALACFLGSLLAERKGWRVLSGVLLAASWIKYTITFPLTLYFLLRRRFREPMIAAAIHTGLTLLAAAITQTSPVKLFADFFAVTKCSLWVINTRSGLMDLTALAERLFTDWSLIGGIAALVLIGLSALILLRSKPLDNLLLLSILAMLSCVAFFHLRYDLVILVFLLGYLVKTGLNHPTGILFATTLALNWYVVRIVEWIPIRWDIPLSHAIDTWFYAFTAAAFWGTFLYVLTRHSPLVARQCAQTGLRPAPADARVSLSAE